MWILSPWHAFISTWLETSAPWFERAAQRLSSCIAFFFSPLPKRFDEWKRGAEGQTRPPKPAEESEIPKCLQVH